MIPYGRQNISEADIQAVVDVLRSDFITQGPAIERFEKSVAAYCGVKYAVAVSNATAGLHIACLAAGLKAGEWLWTVPNTFVASANCALYCGANVDFVDIDPQTYTISLDALHLKLETTPPQKRPRVVVPVHFAGQSCDMIAIQDLAEQYGFTVLEDAAHAIGGRYDGEPIGCCRYSDMAVLSYHPVKIITTGEGGMVLTNREDLYEALIRLRTHGITRNAPLLQHKDEGPWYYEQLELGYNYRLTDIQAALGHSQMGRLDAFVLRRRELAARYDDLLKDLPVVRPWQHPKTESAWHLYVVKISPEAGKSRREVFEALRAAGIGVNVHYIPVHTQPYYRTLGFKPGDFPQSEAYYAQAITLPLYYDLTETEQDEVVSALARALQ